MRVVSVHDFSRVLVEWKQESGSDSVTDNSLSLSL